MVPGRADNGGQGRTGPGSAAGGAAGTRLATLWPMPARVIAFFLAAVLLWSGLGTVELPRTFALPSSAPLHAAGDADRQMRSDAGSVEHHHLDDVPLQAQTDPVTDTPGLLAEAGPPAAPPRAMVHPRMAASAAAWPPFLAGPMRPPCLGAPAG